MHGSEHHRSCYFHNNLSYINVYILYIMVDRYWRQVENIRDDIENSMQISSILLKLKEYDRKLTDISKIDTNKDNITSNLSEINNIKDD